MSYTRSLYGDRIRKSGLRCRVVRYTFYLILQHSHPLYYSLEFVLLYHITQHNAQLGSNVRLHCGLISFWRYLISFSSTCSCLLRPPFFRFRQAPSPMIDCVGHALVSRRSGLCLIPCSCPLTCFTLSLHFSAIFIGLPRNFSQRVIFFRAPSRTARVCICALGSTTYLPGLGGARPNAVAANEWSAAMPTSPQLHNTTTHSHAVRGNSAAVKAPSHGS